MRFSILLFVLLFSGQIVIAQGFGPIGMAFRIGFSTSSTIDPQVATNPALGYPVPSVSALAFTSWRFTRDSSWHLFTDLKFSVGPGFRGGIFDVNGSATRISMTFIDLEIVLPTRVPISQNLNMQFAVGPQLAFVARQTENTPKADTFQPGIIFEWGMGTNQGSFLGFSIGRSLTSYELTNISFMFALSSGEMRRKERK